MIFQSTLSMRRATNGTYSTFADLYISIHALHEESDLRPGLPVHALDISIHALHEESDAGQPAHQPRPVRFQSTLSMRRATRERWKCLAV